MSKPGLALATVATFGGLLAWSSVAHADMTCADQGSTKPACSTLSNPIYVSGSTALEPLYKAIGPTLLAQSTPRAIVYIKGGTEASCSGIRRMTATPPEKLGASLTAKRVDSTGAICDCTIDAGGVDVTVAISDVFAPTCDVTEAAVSAAGLKDFQGPVNSMVFVAPKGSTQTAISFEQAFLALGFGSMYNVLPWTNKDFFFIRPEYSGTLRMIASYIGVPATKWQGKSKNAAGDKDAGSGDVYTAITTAATGLDQYLGILGIDYLLTQLDKTPADADKIKPLAFRGSKQRYAFYPDSSPTSLDKRMVRSGRYLIAGPAHLFAKVIGSDITDAGAKALIDLVRNEDDAATLTTIAKTAHLVPQCAMSVSRTIDGGNLSKFTPTNACDCFFEKAVGATVPASCVTCDVSTPCATGTCRRGVCETR